MGKGKEKEFTQRNHCVVKPENREKGIIFKGTWINGNLEGEAQVIKPGNEPKTMLFEKGKPKKATA